MWGTTRTAEYTRAIMKLFSFLFVSILYERLFQKKKLLTATIEVAIQGLLHVQEKLMFFRFRAQCFLTAIAKIASTAGITESAMPVLVGGFERKPTKSCLTCKECFIFGKIPTTKRILKDRII